MAAEEHTSIGAALTAGVDALDERSFEQFKSEASLGSPSWCQRMKAAERDALAELTAADTMEMQLASLRRQETPGHRATHGGLLGSVRRGNLFDSPVATPDPRSRPTPASPVGADSSPSPTAETLRQQLAAAEEARALADQRYDQLSREAQEAHERADAEIRAERNRAIEALAVAEEARTVADSAAHRCAESDRLLSAMRAEAAATRVAAEHEQASMISVAEAAGLRKQLASEEECRWAAEKELSGERAARRAAEAAIRTEQRKTATFRVAAEQAAQAAQRQADTNQQAWQMKQAELTSSCDELKSELLLAQQKQATSDFEQTASAEQLQQLHALMKQKADLQAQLKCAEEASMAKEANVHSLEADLAGALNRAQLSEQQLQQCRVELTSAEDRARSAELTATASQTELTAVRQQLQVARAATDAEATVTKELEHVRAQQAALEAQHTSAVEQLRQEKEIRLAAEAALKGEREQLDASVHAADSAAEHCAELEQALARAHTEVDSLNKNAVSLLHQIDEATTAQASAESALYEARDQLESEKAKALTQISAEHDSLNEETINLRRQIDEAAAAQASAESALHDAQGRISRLLQEVEAASAFRTEAQEQLDAARASEDNAALQTSTTQAELVMLRAQLQAAQSSQQSEQAQSKREALRATALHEDAERRAESEKAKALDLSSRVVALETELAATQQVCDDKLVELSEALSVAQAELATVRDVEIHGAAQATSQTQELQAAKNAEMQLQKKLAEANAARVEAEKAAQTAAARTTEAKAEAASELQSMSQDLRSTLGACADAKRELEALKVQKTSAPSSDFPGESAVDGAPTRAELNATIELAQKLLANQTEVCEVEKQANKSLHEALGDVTAQLAEAEAVAARWEAATHACTQLLQCVSHSTNLIAVALCKPMALLMRACVCNSRADTMEGHDVLIMGTRTCRRKMFLNMQNI
eukprot:COSAG02_NODE_3057_length_7453_cov_3.637884_3_plen_951_part_00